MFHSLQRFVWQFLVSILMLSGAAASGPQVVTSIAPVHALAVDIMAGVGTPLLLVDGAGSPHDYALRPSQADALSKADMVFWVGPQLEAFLIRPIAVLSSGAHSVILSASPGIKLLPLRNAEAGHREHSVDQDHPGAVAYDMHIWLDPENAQAMSRQIAMELQTADPANAQIYAKNTAALAVRLQAIRQQVEASIKTGAIPPYMVFHDAYQYFENRFGVRPVAIISLDPERPPGAARIRSLQQQIVRDKVVCVFAEPQFEPRLVETLIEGTHAKAAFLDPLGAGLPGAGDFYARLLSQLAAGLTGCGT